MRDFSQPRWCRKADSLDQALDAGNLGFSSVYLGYEFFRSQTDRSWADILHTRGLVPLICDLPFPSRVQITQKGFNLYVWAEFLKQSLPDLASRGCGKLVWRDGRERVLPEEGDVSGLREQVLQFLFMLAETAREQGMTVLVEPLGPRRTNFLTSLKETADFLSLIGADNLLISISTEEMDALGLSPRSLMDAGPLISHITIDPQSEPVLDLLDETGYSGTLAWAGGRA